MSAAGRPMLRVASLVAALVAALVALAPATAWARGDLATLLSREASLALDEEVPAAWTAIVLSDEVLTGSRPDLSDLRLFDARGREAPFVAFGGERQPLTVMLDRVAVDRTSSGTRLVVARPAGFAVERLVLSTTTPAFDRRLEVRDLGPGGGGRRLGAAHARRQPDADGAGAPVVVELRRPGGTALELVVDDGDSPPLDNLVVVAEVTRPILMTTLASAGTLRFGGGRLRAPRYDLPREAARRALDDAARRGAARTVRWADLGDARDNPHFDPLPALAFAMKPGASVPLERYRYRRPVDVPASREGVVELSLDVADRARARADLGDLRVVDDRGRQLPYLVEETGERLRAPLTLDEPLRDEATGHSLHRFGLPGPRVPVTGVELVLASTFADRAYRLVAGEGDDAITIAAGYLRRRPGEGPEVVVELGAIEPVSALALEVEDGDDAPLAVVSATALVPAAELFVVAPEGRYWLMSGAPDVVAPRYELERARPMLLSLSREQARAGRLEDNPAHVPAPSDQPPPILWAVLCLAVAVLGWLTLRAVAEDDDDRTTGRPADQPPLDRHPTLE